MYVSDADRDEFYHGAVYGDTSKAMADTWVKILAGVLWRGVRR